MSSRVASPDIQAPSARLQLRLYIAGNAPNSTMAESNLTALLASNGVTDYELEIIDCIKDPRRALGDGVLVTPTLVRFAPPPPASIVGTLSDAARVGAALGVSASARADRASA